MLTWHRSLHIFTIHSFTKQIRSLKKNERRLGLSTLAFGPQHPAAHGILRMTLQLRGELVIQLDPCFGYLHRGSEKLIETRTFLQALPYFDRFDYVANLFQEHAFCRTIENLLILTSTQTVITHVRVILDELSRILNHLLTLAATSLDLGAMGPIFWAFEEREFIFEILEHLSGARMHTAFHRPGSSDITAFTSRIYDELVLLLNRCMRALSGAVLGLLTNRSLKTRLASVGQISLVRANTYGLSGLSVRSTGGLSDLRKNGLGDYSEIYRSIGLRTFISTRGDNYDRFILRIREVQESLRIIASLLAVTDSLRKTQLPDRETHSSMEAVINHFLLNSSGVLIKPGFSYQSVEAPKGELGVSVIATGDSSIGRTKIRTPVSHTMHLLPSISQGTLIADFVATFCSLDIVLGEIDR